MGVWEAKVRKSKVTEPQVGLAVWSAGLEKHGVGQSTMGAGVLRPCSHGTHATRLRSRELQCSCC